MRRLRFVLAIAAILMSACSKEADIAIDENVAQGEVSIALTSVDTHHVASPVKSVVDVPETSNFFVEIINSKGVRLYGDRYSNTAGKKLLLNAGEYRLLATHGDSLGVGFDKIYFAADQKFTVHGQTSEQISAVAKMANVKVAVNFGKNLGKYYPEHYLLVKRARLKNHLRFNKTEKRAGFIPAGKLIVELYAKVDGTMKYYPTEIQASPNDFITLNIDAPAKEGDIKFSIIVDNSVDVVNKEVLIPAIAAAKEAPSATVSGFTPEHTFTFVDGDPCNELQFNMAAEAGFKSCVLNASSSYLSALGLPEQIDLIAAGPEVAEKLASCGIYFSKGIADLRLASVDFRHITDKVIYNPENVFSGTFSLTVIDNQGRQAQSPLCTITQQPAEMVLAAAEHNAFAKKITGMTVNVAKGNPAKVQVQISTDKQVWTPVPATGIAASTISLQDITGLLPATQYHVRAVYNGNEKETTPVVTLTTESAAQIGNSGFEEFTDQNYQFQVNWGRTNECKWYLPYTSAGTAWWAVNSKKTMYTDVNAGALEFKVFPTVSYSTSSKSEGTKAAQITTVATDRLFGTAAGGGGEVVPGELWIGTADNNGNHTSDGHAFPSRPESFSFWYQYQPYKSEPFLARIQIKAADGSVIASAELSDSAAEKGGKRVTLPLVYTDLTKKATQICVLFRSSNAGKPSYSYNVTLEMGGQNRTSHIGSILRVDDLKLEY